MLRTDKAGKTRGNRVAQINEDTAVLKREDILEQSKTVSTGKQSARAAICSKLRNNRCVITLPGQPGYQPVRGIMKSKFRRK